MADRISIGDMQVSLTAGRGGAQPRPEPGEPFCIAVLGDFTGRGSRGVAQPITGPDPRRPIAVDCDNFDRVMAKLAPSLQLDVSGQGDAQIEIKFSELEDFHPDQLYDRLELFQALRKTRSDLLDPSTFKSAAAEMGQWAQATPPPDANDPAPSASDSPTPSKGDNPFAQLLGKPATSSTDSSKSSYNASPIDALLKQVVGPHVVPNPDPRQADLVSAIDNATGQQMRAILHHPQYQALEAAWRALDYLVRHLETSEELRLFIIDATKQELANDLLAAHDLSGTDIYRLLVEQSVGSAGGRPWSVLVGNYEFDATTDDALLIEALAKIAAQAGASFIGAASGHLVGCDSFARTPSPGDWTRPIQPEAHDAWQSLRKLPEVSHVALAMPRFLLRLPYGANTDPIEQFEFNEIGAQTDAAAYLWGNPAFLCAYLLGDQFTQSGWGFTPGGGYDVGDLPTHTYKTDGESCMTPCAEAWLTDRGADQILAAGYMPMLSIQGRDAVRVVRFQSLADPVRNLAGRWG